MAQFYKELKELRISKEISLDELEVRTKINIKYLKAIEEGNFDILPIPYLRLFIRAYATEIGGDAERALEQLDSFIGNISPKITPVKQNDDYYEEKKVIDQSLISDLFSKSNLKLRKDIITVSILSVFFIFSIIIIKKIFSKESTITNDIAMVNNSNVKLITKEILLKDYTEDKFLEESLSSEPPFFLTLFSGSNISISIKQDSLRMYNKYLSPGKELNINGFISKADLIFSNTKKLRIRLNGISLNKIENYNYPLRLIIKASPPSFIARLYRPIN